MVDKDKDPELRHTVLTLVAFHDLEEKIRACGGDRDKSIEAFLNQNDGQGWMLPETLRLANYGLGHDDRAREQQPVADRLGPRFYDWQLAQSPEESWRECHLHARNMLGREGYQNLLGEVLKDTSPDLWGQALASACDLGEKAHLVRVVAHALGMLPPEKWASRMAPTQALFQKRGFDWRPGDALATIVPGLRCLPEEKIAEGMAAARLILGADDFKKALEPVLVRLSAQGRQAWIQALRVQMGASGCEKLLADLKLEAAAPSRDQTAPSRKKKQRDVQLGLFE